LPEGRKAGRPEGRNIGLLKRGKAKRGTGPRAENRDWLGFGGTEVETVACPYFEGGRHEGPDGNDQLQVSGSEFRLLTVLFEILNNVGPIL